jgi:hypothetical protein
VLSRDAQSLLTKEGRLPTRPDVPTNPPGVTEILNQKKVIAAVFSAEEQKKWSAEFNAIFRPK